MTPRRILAATDLTPAGERAAIRAARLAARFGAALTLLHVLERGPRERRLWSRFVAARPDDGEATLATWAEEGLEALADHIENLCGIRPHHVVETGRPDRTIVEHVADHAMDLLVLGTGGSGRGLEGFTGSVAERVVREVAGPALVVRAESDREYGRLLVATDGSAASAAALDHALTLAPDAELFVLHVVDTWLEDRAQAAGVDDEALYTLRHEAVTEARGEITGWLGEHLPPGFSVPVGGHLLVRAGHPSSVLAHVMADYCPDLLALGASGLGGVERMLLGSMTEEGLRRAVGDVLITDAGDTVSI